MFKVKLEEICKKITDGSHYSPKAVESGYPMFSVKDMLEYGFSYDNCKRVNDEDFKRLKASGCVPQAGDVLVAKDGSYLKEIFVYREEKEEAILSSIAIFRPDTDKVTSDFLCYLLKTPKVYNFIKNNCVSGSALPRIVLKEFKTVELEIPDIDSQNKIVGILAGIDEKIRLNNKINDNLFQQVQTIFKEMFPDILNSEAHDTLEAVARFSNGKKRPKSDGMIPVYGGNGILAYTSESNAENCVIIGRVGAYCGNTYICTNKCWVSDNAILAKSKVSDSPTFIYYLLKNASLPSRHIGTGQPLMTQGILNSIPIIKPSEEKVQKFINITDPIQSIIEEKNNENNILIAVRDALLTKLMSGELDVSCLDI